MKRVILNWLMTKAEEFSQMTLNQKSLLLYQAASNV